MRSDHGTERATCLVRERDESPGALPEREPRRDERGGAPHQTGDTTNAHNGILRILEALPAKTKVSEGVGHVEP